MPQELKVVSPPPLTDAEIIADWRAWESAPYKLSFWEEHFVPFYIAIAGFGAISSVLTYNVWKEYYADLDHYRHFGPSVYPQEPNIPFWFYPISALALLYGLAFLFKFLDRITPRKAVAPLPLPQPPRTSDLYGKAKMDDYEDAVMALRDDEGGLPDVKFAD